MSTTEIGFLKDGGEFLAVVVLQIRLSIMAVLSTQVSVYLEMGGKVSVKKHLIFLSSLCSITKQFSFHLSSVCL